MSSTNGGLLVLAPFRHVASSHFAHLQIRVLYMPKGLFSVSSILFVKFSFKVLCESLHNVSLKLPL